VPDGDGEVTDGGDFEVCMGGEVGDELLVKGVECLLGFGLEDEAFGVEAVSAAIAGGAEFAFGGFGATGESAVGSRGSDSN